METIPKSSRASLQPNHIRTAFEIPSANETRNLFVQACVKEYAESFFDTTGSKAKEFRLKEELGASDAFAAALLTEFANLFRTRTTFWGGRGLTTNDPLSGESLHVYNLSWN